MFNNSQDAMDFLDMLTIGPTTTKRKPMFNPYHDSSMTPNKINDHIEKYYYKLINIPDIMAKRSAYELHDTTAGPIKLPFGYEVSEGRFTIAWMIESFAKQIPFEFAKWEDCCEVSGYLVSYIEILERDMIDLKKKVNDSQLEDLYTQAETYIHMVRTLEQYLTPLAKRLHHYHSVTDKERQRAFMVGKVFPRTDREQDEYFKNVKYLRCSADKVLRSK